MRIVIAGASGLIGTHMSATFRDAGHQVVSLVRREPSSAAEVRWNPAAGELDPRALAGADAVVNLSGAGIGDRPWTRRRVEELLKSRLDATRTLTQAMGQLDSPPQVFVSQSGANYYGDAGNTVLRENAPQGTGTLARICGEWEAAAATAPQGVRVVNPRTAVVLSHSGGALGRLLPLIRLGVGGPLGNGRQFWPWVTLPDVSAAFLFLLQSDLSGPVNLCAPEEADVNTLVAALARALHRPAALRVPAPVLRLAMRNLADELLLASQRMEPDRLSSAGFTWEHPTLEQAVQWVVGKE
ncbi:TIGR01777 family oxidoreductase [Arthrobacter sp. W4I7]|uniref:TIGR01777 family oxidoreductase n=1 Tax=Arthrobacter sp. W4I7 TaxID=3042296 RepID=UPI0027D8D6D2|nr:TIGR01777 family oxidoreductase [Arthrobacter sp. W4I7]